MCPFHNKTTERPTTSGTILFFRRGVIMNNLPNRGNDPSREAVLTRREAADYLRVSLSCFDRLGVPRIKVRRKMLFRRETLDRWLAENEAAAKRGNV
jgi:excisionase family DNA binding protein